MLKCSSISMEKGEEWRGQEGTEKSSKGDNNSSPDLVWSINLYKSRRNTGIFKILFTYLLLSPFGLRSLDDQTFFFPDKKTDDHNSDLN